MDKARLFYFSNAQCQQNGNGEEIRYKHIFNSLNLYALFYLFAFRNKIWTVDYSV